MPALVPWQTAVPIVPKIELVEQTWEAGRTVISALVYFPMPGKDFVTSSTPKSVTVVEPDEEEDELVSMAVGALQALKISSRNAKEIGASPKTFGKLTLFNSK